MFTQNGRPAELLVALSGLAEGRAGKGGRAQGTESYQRLAFPPGVKDREYHTLQIIS